MRPVIVALRIGDRRRCRAGRRDQIRENHRHRPVGHHRNRKQCGDRHGAGRGFGPPSDGDGRCREHHERGERDRVVLAGQNEKRRDQQISRQRQCREPIDFAGSRLGAIQQAADQEDGGEDVAGERVDDVRADRFDREQIGSRKRPQRAKRDRGDGEPRPQSRACQRKCGRGNHRNVNVKRPVIRLRGSNQERSDKGADDAQAG